MRPLEGILAVSILKILWFGFYAETIETSLLVILLISHIILEKLRWQSLLLVFAVLVLPTSSFLASTLGLMGYILLMAMPVPVLPEPSKKVGILKKKWILPGGKELDTIFHYPTEPDASLSESVPWMDSTTIQAVTQNGVSKKIPLFLLSHFSLSTLSIQKETPVSSSQSQYPFILFSPGLKGVPEVYSSITTQLASLGYIICTVNHTDGSSSLDFDHTLPIDDWEGRNKQLNIRINDMQFVLNKILDSSDPTIGVLVSHIDKKKLSVMGHSFGAASAIKFCQDMDMISSCVALDPWMFSLSPSDLTINSDKSILILGSNSWQWAQNRKKMEDKILLLDKNSAIHYIDGVSHHNFSDVPFFAAECVLQTVGVIGSMPRDQGLDLIITHTNQFFESIQSEQEIDSTNQDKLELDLMWKPIVKTVLHPQATKPKTQSRKYYTKQKS